MAERRPGELRCPAMCNDKTKELRENERSRNAPHGSRTDVASDMHTHVLPSLFVLMYPMALLLLVRGYTAERGYRWADGGTVGCSCRGGTGTPACSRRGGTPACSRRGRYTPELYERHFVPPPPLYVDPPSMDLGQFEISKGPCWRGGLDLGLFEISKGPCWRGGVGPWTF